MQVIATAGHVDHGKSTLVRALTGMEPDRWAEERRRGMTIDLGFAWTTLPSGASVAFVDVPGHERFVPNMLAGVGPVPAVLLVVSADEGWMPQTAEHVAALDALGVRHAVVAVTRSDRADPGPVTADVADRLAPTSLADAPAVAVSGTTGDGLPALVAALDALVAGLPAPDPHGPVRLWVDRAFTIRGSGTVVTGTLGTGTLRHDDDLVLFGGRGERGVRVRQLQALGQPLAELGPVSRAAVNLRGVEREDVSRGDVLLTPDSWPGTDTMDVRLRTGNRRLPAELVLHVGSAAVAARVRLLAGGPTARLALARPLPLISGDVALLRDPGRHLIAAALTVLDADPPPLTRRGAAAARARELTDPADDATAARREQERNARWRAAITVTVGEHRSRAPLEPGPTVEEVRRRVGAPDRPTVVRLVRKPLAVQDGRIVDTAAAALPPAVAAAAAVLVADLAEHPFDAPDSARLRELGLGARELAAAERAGMLLRIADGVVLLPDAARHAARHLDGIDQPFTLSQARQRLGTSRRVAVPLLELLDRQRLTRRLPGDRRVLISGMLDM